MTENNKRVPGTIMFDGPIATRGYNLNKMCFSFNAAAAREAFKADEAGYCERFGLTPDQTEAVLKRDVIALLNLGGSIYYMAKFTGLLGMNMQDIGALQTGKTVDEFKAYLDSQGRGKENG